MLKFIQFYHVKNIILGFFMVNLTYANNNFDGEVSDIPHYMQKEIGHSWNKKCPVLLQDLALVTVKYWGYDDKPHIGSIIINAELAQDILDIFSTLFKKKFHARTTTAGTFSIAHSDIS